MMSISPILSLADTFTATFKRGVFTHIGRGADGQHVVITNRDLIETNVHVDYENVNHLNRYASMYNLVNTRGTVYGLLFSVKGDYSLTPSRLLIPCNKVDTHDFVQKVADQIVLFVSSSGAVVAIVPPCAKPRYLVKEH